MSQDKRLKVLLLGAGFGTDNMGVGALACGALRCLRSHGRNPQVSILDYGTEDTVTTMDAEGRELVIPIVAMRFSKKLYLSNNIVILLLLAALLRAVPSRKFRELVIVRNRRLHQILEADIAMAISGGDSFSDIYGLGRLFYVALPQLLVLLLKKRLVLLPQTLGPFEGWLSRRIALLILQRAERAYSRDYAGLELMKRTLGRGFDSNQHRFCYDLGFVLEPRRPVQLATQYFETPSSDGSVLVGLNVSGLLWISRDKKFGCRSDYRGLMHAVIDHLMSIPGVQILLIPHVFGFEQGSESDLVICSELFKELSSKYPGRLDALQVSLDQCEVKALIGTCDFFIGSRMHACIAALSQHIPAVAIAYSDKFIGVLDTIGVPSLVADVRKLETQQVLCVISEALSSRQLLRAQLVRRIPAIKATVLNLCSELPEFQAEWESSPELILSGR